MKTCKQCGKDKLRDDFYPHNKMADGLLSKCKQCICANVRKHRLNNIEKVRAYDLDRAKTDKRKAATFAQTKKLRSEDSRRVRCHNAVARATKAGTLIKQPCDVCGDEKSVAHHEDYDRPLDVTWLCQPCHKARHKEIDEEFKNRKEAA